MANWLKHFDQTALGMLFTDQFLSPSEIVRIAKQEQCANPAQCLAAEEKRRSDPLPHTRLVGMR